MYDNMKPVFDNWMRAHGKEDTLERFAGTNIPKEVLEEWANPTKFSLTVYREDGLHIGNASISQSFPYTKGTYQEVVQFLDSEHIKGNVRKGYTYKIKTAKVNDY